MNLPVPQILLVQSILARSATFRRDEYPTYFYSSEGLSLAPTEFVMLDDILGGGYMVATYLRSIEDAAALSHLGRLSAITQAEYWPSLPVPATYTQRPEKFTKFHFALHYASPLFRHEGQRLGDSQVILSFDNNPVKIDGEMIYDGAELIAKEKLEHIGKCIQSIGVVSQTIFRFKKLESDLASARQESKQLKAYISNGVQTVILPPAVVVDERSKR